MRKVTFLKKNTSNIKMIFVGILTGMCNGLFGAGGGIILVPSLEKFLDMEAHKAHATTIAVIFPLSIISAIIYVKNIETNYKLTFLCSIGGMIGGMIGAKILNRVPTLWLHRIFGFFMMIAGIRMII